MKGQVTNCFGFVTILQNILHPKQFPNHDGKKLFFSDVTVKFSKVYLKPKNGTAIMETANFIIKSPDDD